MDNITYEFGYDSSVFKGTAQITPLKLRHFHVGIPYGALLSTGGFLSFMFTGSIPAVRFGIVLGGTLLALSVTSLKLWKKGEPTSLLLKGQTATIYCNPHQWRSSCILSPQDHQRQRAATRC